MEDYKNLARELIEEHIAVQLVGGYADNREEVLKALQDDTENVFGNYDGSRTMSTYEAQQFIDKSGAIWDDDIHDLYSEMGDDYMSATLKRGAETFDVVTLELVAPQVIAEMLED